jgi:sialate O-acetylesterase
VGVHRHTLNSYPSVLGRLMGSGYQVCRFGVPGATAMKKSTHSYGDTTAFRQALAFQPDIVIISLGTNDNLPDFEAEHVGDFLQGYKELIAAFRRVNPAIRVYVCLPPPMYPLYGRGNLRFQKYVSPRIRRIAQSNDANLIDYYTPLLGQPTLFIDGVHPNEEGARILGSTAHHALMGDRSAS